MNESKRKEALARGEAQSDLLRSLPLPKDVEAVLSRLASWTLEHGAALCPNGRPDSFGEGMRAAKDQIAAILARMRRETDDAPSSVLRRIECAICVEGDYAPDSPDDTRHPVERRIAAMRAVIEQLTDAQDDHRRAEAQRAGRSHT